MKFLFNQQIIFDSDTGTLFLTDMPDDTIQISNPTKRLLLLLVCHQGEVIHREVIFKKVWDDFGMVSSNNNLNHCISKLRRILRNLGLEDEVITTVPKLGFMFHQQIAVETLPETVESPLNAPFSSSSADTMTGNAAEIRTTNLSGQSLKLLHRMSLFALIFSLLALMASLYFWYQRIPEERKEVYIGEAGSCEVLATVPLQSSDDPESFKQGILRYAQSLNPKCRSDQYVLVIKSNSLRVYSKDLSRLYFMQCGNLRDNKAEVCWSLNEPTPAS